MISRTIRVSGDVQGVFYRKYTREAAERIGVTGLVRNLPEGDVEILVTGTSEQVQQLIDWCWTGSPRSRVQLVTVQEKALELFTGFRIER